VITNLENIFFTVYLPKKTHFNHKPIVLIMCLTCILQTAPVLIGISVVVITILFLVLNSGGSNGDRKQSKFPKTLQDPNLKYQLPLIEKEVIM